MVRRLPPIAIDTETTGLHLHHGCRGFMVTACTLDGDLFKWEFPINTATRKPIYDTPTCQDIYDTLTSYSCWVFHNAKFDLQVLSYIYSGFNLDLYEQWNIHDTMLQSHIYDSSSTHALKDLAVLHLDLLDDDEKALKQAVQQARTATKSLGWKTAKESDEQLPAKGSLYLCDYWLPKAAAEALNYPSEHPWYTICEVYGLRDVERTILLYKLFSEYLRDNNLAAVYDAHRKVIPIVYGIEQEGLRISRVRSDRMLSNMRKDMNAELATIKRIAAAEGFPDYNWKSYKQKNHLLYEHWDMPVLKLTKTGNPSVDSGTIEELIELGVAEDDAQREMLEAHMRLSKLNTYSDYIKGYQRFMLPSKKGLCLYPSLNQTGTKTIRFSCSNPNGQNIGKGDDEEDEQGEVQRKHNLRELFGPRPGYVWYAIDYSSLQLIIFAYESGSKELIKVFREGGDPHNHVACGIFDTKNPTELERRIAKNVNYGLIFGAGERKIDLTAGRQGTFKEYLDQFPDSKRYMDEIIREVRRTGVVHTAWGYPLTVPIDKAYKGVNFVIQGDEGEIVKRAMVNCHHYLRHDDPNRRPNFHARLIMNIHDELLFEAPADYPFPLDAIIECMMRPAAEIGWHTPVDASLIKEHWGSKVSVTQADIDSFIAG